MLALISPAKKLDYDSEWHIKNPTQPALLKQSEKLVDTLQALSKNKLQKLMKLSDNLTTLNYNRYQRFSTPFTTDNARPAITAFRGDTYIGLDADTLSSGDLRFAQKHLGILSGLYGVLRPLDLMQAYRLEMGTKLQTTEGKNLYEYWKDIPTKLCNERIKKHKNKTVISLASNEYIKVIKPKELNGDFITCHFKEMKFGEPKTIGLFAKRARGMMARYMIQNRIEQPEALKDFKNDGYNFIPSLSDANNFLFLRDRE